MKKLKENLGVQKLEGKTIMISVNSVNFVNLIYRIYRNYTHQFFQRFSKGLKSGFSVDITGLGEI